MRIKIKYSIALGVLLFQPISLALYGDSLRLRLGLGNNYGEQTDERMLQSRGILIGIGETGFDSDHFSSIVRKTAYKKRYPFFSLGLDYDTGNFTLTGAFRTNVGRYSGKYIRRDSKSCLEESCGPLSFPMNVAEASIRDSSHRLHIPNYFVSSFEIGETSLKEFSGSLSLRYFPSSYGDDKKGFFFVAGFNETRFRLGARSSLLHSSKPFVHTYEELFQNVHIYLPMEHSVYSGKTRAAEIGIGYRTDIWTNYALDLDVRYLKGEGTYEGSTYSPYSLTHSIWEGKTFGKGYAYMLRLSYTGLKGYEFGLGLGGRHYFAEGREKMRGGALPDIILFNEINRLMKNDQTTPSFSGFVEHSLELFVAKRFNLR